jgi:hypothetical protein
VRSWLLLVVGVLGLWWAMRVPSVEHGPGVLAPDPPEQLPPGDPRSFQHLGYLLEPLADFRLRARVLGARSYRFDRESDLSPLDLALGWGRMSDSEVLAGFRFSQSGRWYHYKTDDWPIPRREVISHSANMHMIPASPEVEDRLGDLAEGSVVSITGQLVAAEGSDGWTWRSSLSRTDRGARSCELIWVESIEIH